MSLDVTPRQLSRWRIAVSAVFLVSGLSVATWAARVPAIKTPWAWTAPPSGSCC